MSSDRELASQAHHHWGPQRDAEDTAAVIAVLAALSADSAEMGMTSSPLRSLWAAPQHATSHRHLATAPSSSGWWASGLPR